MACSRCLALGLGDGLYPVELLAALGELLGGQLRQIEVVELPGGVRAPPERRLHGGPGGGRALEELERELERLGLRGGVEGAPGRIAERKVAEQEARHAAVLHDVLRT